jgi:hypothetical protein
MQGDSPRTNCLIKEWAKDYLPHPSRHQHTIHPTRRHLLRAKENVSEGDNTTGIVNGELDNAVCLGQYDLVHMPKTSL